MTSAPDLNARIAGVLFDLASIQSSKFRRSAYHGAGEAILGLDAQLDTLRASDGKLPRIPSVGPSSLRIVEEVLATGTSATADRAIAESPKSAEVTERHERGMHGLSLARVREILADTTLDGPTVADHHGDFQMHSDWSDGRTTLEVMAKACVDRGYRFSAITDHSLGTPIPRGLTSETMPQQREALARINKQYEGRFRYLAGIEANIRADGSLDVEPNDRKSLEIVVASPHAKLRLAEDQTARMIAAVSVSGVHILGHPRGRVWGARAGIRADWDAVFAAAATHKVAIEIDGDPRRQDLDYVLAERALKAGCLFALDSDAHHPDQLPYSEFAIAHARLAGIPRDRIINCWELQRLLDWSRSRH
jgi:putative hydrolase